MTGTTDGVGARSTATPVQVSERIISLDVLRGFAILGILVMNIQSFSMIGAAYLNPTAFGDLTGINRLVWQLSHMFADLKFVSIFSMLFGAGIVLFSSKLESRGIAPGALHYRRTFWLLLIGLAHGFCLWYGDILAAYALVAIVAYLFWRRSPVALLITGAAVLAFGSLLTWFFGSSMSYWPPESVAMMAEFWTPTAEAVSREIAAYTGGWGAQMAHRVPSEIGHLTYVFWTSTVWRAGGMMLVGMGLFKLGVFSAERSKRFYAIGVAIGLAIGLPTVYLGVLRRFADGWTIEYGFFQVAVYNQVGSIFVALAYVLLVMLIVKAAPAGWFSRLLAPVGRMAFTNYLLQTILCTTLFFGHGFGLFGSMERGAQVIVVLTIWVFEIWLSHVWLARFRFGPAEWLWRSLTYMRPQPMRR